MISKAQHYVPQFYLRNFAIKRKKHYFINCFDKATGNSFQSNVKNIAQQTYFYDFEVQDGEIASIEALLSNLEGKVKPVLDEIISVQTIDCVKENLLILSYFIFIQEMRTPIFRDSYEDMITSANESIGNKLNTHQSVFKPPTDNDTREFQTLFMLSKADELTEVMRKMKWIFLRNDSEELFWTSDNPVFRYNPNVSEFIGNSGLMSPGIQIYFPFSPRNALIICDPISYSELPLELNCIKENVDFQNSGQVINSRQYLFSYDQGFSLASDMVKENPELRDIDRPRLQTV